MITVGNYLVDIYPTKPRSAVLNYDYDFGSFSDYLSTGVNYLVAYDPITLLSVLEIPVSDDNLIEMNRAFISVCDNLGIDNNNDDGSIIPKNYANVTIDILPSIHLRNGYISISRNSLDRGRINFSIISVGKGTVFAIQLSEQEVLAFYNLIDKKITIGGKKYYE